MVDLLNQTAGLLEGNTRASTANQDRHAARAMKAEELLTSRANNREEQAGATERTAMNNKQAQLLQNLKDQAEMALNTMAQKEESKRQEKALTEQAAREHQENYFTMTPNLVKGIKDTIDLDFKALEGKEVNVSVILGLISAKYKTDVAGINASSKSGKDPEDLKKELRRLEETIKGNRDKLMTSSFKDLPEEAWGGEPGNFRKLTNYISAGNFGNLDANQKSQVQMVAGYINTMKAQQKRANEINKQLQSNPIDYTGMGLEDGGGTGAPKKYATKEDVKAAFKAGTISRGDAAKILRDEFGMK